MIHIETIDLSLRGVILPADRVGVVVAQPYVTLTAAEPFRCTVESKPQQMAMIREVLAISKNPSHHCEKTHFTLFPEYSIPGIDGIQLIEDAISEAEWPCATVVVGGVDALTREEYTQILNEENTHVDEGRNGPVHVQTDEWVNCAVTWIKSAEGVVERWVQPKLHPAWPEMDTNYQYMFKGHSIFLFKGLLDNETPFRFGTLICFDWVSTIDMLRAPDWLLRAIHDEAIGCQLPLSWLFVIQRNKKPSHTAFLTEVTRFFDQTQFPNALRDRAGIVFANNAGAPKPSRVTTYGGCSVVFSNRSGFCDPTCVPTYAAAGTRYRGGSEILNTLCDNYFREGGACIHSFALVNPGSLVPGAGGRALPLEYARVYPVGGQRDVRAPGAEVPACVKWFNDELDEIPKLSDQYGNAPLVAQVADAHGSNVLSLRSISAMDVNHVIKMATQGATAATADEWRDAESSALQHVLNSVDILRVGFEVLSVGVGSVHASIEIRGVVVDVLAVTGQTHEKCITHAQQLALSPNRPMLLVTRDPDNTEWLQVYGNFLTRLAQQVQTDRDITDPWSGMFHFGYQNLLTLFRTANTANDISGGFNDALSS